MTCEAEFIVFILSMSNLIRVDNGKVVPFGAKTFFDLIKKTDKLLYLLGNFLNFALM